MREVGIKITATDDASKKLDRIANAVEKMADQTNKNFDKVTRSTFGFRLGLNQLFQAANKGAMVLRSLGMRLSEIVKDSLAFRFSYDEARAAIEGFGKEIQLTSARIGDLFIPALRGIVAGFTPVLEKMQQWAKTNKEVASSKIVDFVVDLAAVTGTALAVATSTAVELWSNLSAVWNSGAAAYHRLNAAISRSKADMLLAADNITEAQTREMLGYMKAAEASEKYADAAEAAAAKDYAIGQQRVKTIYEWEQAIFSALEVSRKFGKEYVDNIDGANVATDALEKSWSEISGSMDKAMDRLAAFTAKFTADADAARAQQAADADARVLQYQGDIIAYRSALQEKQLAEFDANAQIVLDNIAAGEKVRDVFRDVARSVAASFADIVTDLRKEFETIGDIQTDTVQRIAIKSKENSDVVERYVSNISKSEIDALKRVGRTVEVVHETMAIRTKNAGDAIEAVWDRVIDSIITKITQMLAENAILFVANMLLGAATSGGSTAVSAVAGLSLGDFASKLSIGSFAHGGKVQHAAGGLMVSGGSAGRDSVPIMAMAGERVLSRTETRTYERSHSTTMQPAPAAPMPRPIQLLAFSPNRTDYRRWIRDVHEPEQNILRKRGVIKAYK